jgi:hypothetical protein
MIKFLTVLFFSTLIIFNSSAQDVQADEPVASIVVYASDPNNIPEVPVKKLSEVIQVTLQGIDISDYQTISTDMLPAAVTQTLSTRYYNRGFEGSNFQKIVSTTGETFYALDLTSSNTAIFIMLDEGGRVFKAELK